MEEAKKEIAKYFHINNPTGDSYNKNQIFFYRLNSFVFILILRKTKGAGTCM